MWIRCWGSPGWLDVKGTPNEHHFGLFPILRHICFTRPVWETTRVENGKLLTSTAARALNPNNGSTLASHDSPGMSRGRRMAGTGRLQLLWSMIRGNYISVL